MSPPDAYFIYKLPVERVTLHFDITSGCCVVIYLPSITLLFVGISFMACPHLCWTNNGGEYEYIYSRIHFFLRGY